MQLNTMQLNTFRYNVEYTNKQLILKANNINFITKNYKIYMLTAEKKHLLQFCNNIILTDICLSIELHNKLLELYKKSVFDWFIFLDIKPIKIAENEKTNNKKGSFLYLGDLKKSFKKISKIYYNIDSLYENL